MMRMIRYTSRKLEATLKLLKEESIRKSVQKLQDSIEKVLDSIKIITDCDTVKRNMKYITENLGRVIIIE